MLKRIGELDLTRGEVFTAYMRGWIAIDPESGAFLHATDGRTSKAPKYILILPNKSVDERGGLLSTDMDFDYPSGRKIVRAWDAGEAIEAANVKLQKMLKAEVTK